MMNWRLNSLRRGLCSKLNIKTISTFNPLYAKRYEIVNGIVEAEGVSEASLDHEEVKEKEKGVPDFWLTAMKTNEVLAEEISERDEEALKYLKDIKWYRIDNPKGFKLEFFFDTNSGGARTGRYSMEYPRDLVAPPLDTNPFFKNTLLTKTYHMIDEDEPLLEKAIGTEIEWYPGKCLTQKISKKKPRKGSKNAKPITKTEDCESFFNFFSPPQVPEDDDEIVEQLQCQMEQDYDIGSTIRNKIIPHAVSWFTGEAVQGDEFEDIDGDDDEDEDGDEDDDEDEGDDDDEDEEDEDEDEGKTRKKSSGSKKGGRALGGEGQQGDRPPECKQQ